MTTTWILTLTLAALSLVLVATTAPAAGQASSPDDYAALRAEAERQYDEGSFELAHRTYERAAAVAPDDEARRWVAFRLADTDWRSAASTQDQDTSRLDAARIALEALAPLDTAVEERDRVWAEVQESLADLAWSRAGAQDWSRAQPHYAAALEWWGRARDVELARERYLAMVWEMVQPRWHRQYYGVRIQPSWLDRTVLENAVRVAETDADLARASLYLALYDQGQGRHPLQARRTLHSFDVAVERSAGTEWRDDALYSRGLYLENTGRAERDERGRWTSTPDYRAALADYRALLQEFERGESSWHDDARRRIESITAVQLGVGVDRFFLPGSLVAYDLSWRNVRTVELALHPVSLVEDVAFPGADDLNWLAHLDLEKREPLRRWTHATEDAGDHAPGSARLTLDEPLAPGAYVLVARGGGETRRELVLVSDVAVTAKVSSGQVLAWATDALTGRPVEGARVRLWQRHRDGGDWRLGSVRGTTDADGVALLDVPASERWWQWYLAVEAGERQAYAASNGPRAAGADRSYHIHAQPDRPAYRPGETVHWRIVARQRDAGDWRTPAGERLWYDVRDPRGQSLSEGVLELNAYGAAWSSFELPADATLGQYQVHWHRVDGRDQKGATFAGAPLFRLEEYKLPEFEVEVVAAAEGDEAARAFVLGDRLEFDVQATYYWGAPVQDAEVQVLVHQRPWDFRWPDERPYPWLREGDGGRGRNWWGGPGQQVLSTTVRTDAAGRARVTLDTPFDADSDLEYTVEARVTDASRREVVGTGSVHVTRQEYYARVRLEHKVHRPGQAVDVTFETRDANGAPVGEQGRARVVRLRYQEVWHDPAGGEWRGRDRFRLERAASNTTEVARPADPRVAGWVLVREGYVEEEVATTVLTTSDESGEVGWSFTPTEVGTYAVRWLGRDSRRVPVEAEVLLWVCTEDTRELGYRPGQLELLVDEDTVSPGGRATAVLTSATGNRWVLFTVEGEALYEHRVVHLEGSVALVHVDVTERHTPNVWLGAAMVADGRAWSDSAELVVPPVEALLDVTVEPAADVYEPGAEGALTVTVTDHAGRPVEVELAVAVYDAALEAIQADLVPELQAFFHGHRQDHSVSLSGSFDHRRYAKLAEGEDGEVVETVWAETRQYRGPGDTVPPGAAMKSETMVLERGAAYAPATAGSASADGEGFFADSLAALGYGGGGGGGGGGGEPAVRVRSDFRKSALWLPSVVTDAEGHARVSVPFPDSTTRWRAVARGVDTGVRVGQGDADVRTRQPLIARLQAPRFLQAEDEVTISGNLMNATDRDLEVRATLDAGTSGLGLDGAFGRAVERTVVVPANGEARVDWRVEVPALSALDLRLGTGPAPGTARLVLTAVAEGGLSDGMELTLPTVPRGIEALVAATGRLDGDELTATLELPDGAARPRLQVDVTPSLAVTMLDALPYLIDYPYGCVEQTLSRFLPSVVVAKTLRDQGLSPEAAMTRAFGGVEERFAGRTHPEGERALAELDAMVEEGLARLYDMQRPGGGWGWWASGDGDPFMSAYVLWGLSLARDAGVEVRPAVLANAAEWLAAELVEAEAEPELGAWMLHALTAWGGELDAQRAGYVDAAFERLAAADRTGLGAYARALYALACHRSGRADEARRLVDNLSNGVKRDTSPDTSIVARDGGASAPYTLATAHWGSDGVWRRWSDGPVEATATALRALLAIQPEHELVEPVTNWLVRNRRGAQWDNTRDTAMAVLALNDRLRATGEVARPVGFEVLVNGTPVGSFELQPDELLAAPTRIELEGEPLRLGANDVTIRRTSGDAPLYFAAYARFFDGSRPIEARGHELFVRRQYYRLVPRETLLEGVVYDRVPLHEGDALESGERVEVVVTAEAKNDLRYLVLEDLKPAGFEAVALQSGTPAYAFRLTAAEAEARFRADGEEAARRRAGDARDPSDDVQRSGRGQREGYTGERRWIHQELRDRLVASFVDRLPEGFWELRYELRAEVPGSFVALPVLGKAMYVPEIRANGRDQALRILDAGTPGD